MFQTTNQFFVWLDGWRTLIIFAKIGSPLSSVEAMDDALHVLLVAGAMPSRENLWLVKHGLL